MVVADVFGLPLCLACAMWLGARQLHLPVHQEVLLYVINTIVTIPVFAVSGLYRAVIRFIEQRLLAAAGFGLALIVVLASLALQVLNYPALPGSVLVIYWFTALSYVVSSRLLARVFLRAGNLQHSGARGPAVAIYGAGEAGVKLAIAMRASGKYRPVCFFDDKLSLDGRNVAGLRVFHAARLVQVVQQRHVGLIVISIPSATPEQRRDILARAHAANVSVKVLGSLLELADEEITIRSIRDIKIDDLLGREPIQPQHELFEKCVRGLNVLVTGGGGSIGSELCRQIASLAPRALHVLDHSEPALYAIAEELAVRFPGVHVVPHLGSVCDAGLVTHILQQRIDTIYHAAAYKHVPLIESNVAEGIRNNVMGASVLTSAADKAGVKTCVLVSTDKAVRPTSIMGASKRIAELIFQAAASVNKNNTVFCMVRFGNVLGSSGSVVPLFKNQIERGGPITITHPDVVRYFMSIPEAAQLVIQAGAMAVGGDVFVMDMGEPVKIVDLARTMIAMCGLSERHAGNPQGDIELQYVGLRPGEKLYEELFAGNDAISSRHPRIMTTTEYMIDANVLAQQVAYLMVACATNDVITARFIVQKLVRGFASPDDSAQVDKVARPALHDAWRLADGVQLRG